MRYTFGDYVLDTQRAELQGAETPIKLRRKVFQVLAYLLAHRERVVPKEELLEQLWPEQFVGDETLKSCLKTLRQALGDRGRPPRFVHTLHGQGYRFVAPVTECLDVSPDTAPSPLLPAPPLLETHLPPLPVAAVSPVSSASSLSPSLFPPPIELPPPFQHLPAGERRQVTVLCGTLAHATALADQLGLAAFQCLIQTFHALAYACVQRYEGSIQPLGEEGVLALFGVSGTQEEHAWRAVRAALGLLQRLLEASPGGALLLGEEFTARVGVHTGWVVVGSPSDAPTRAMVVGGDTVQGAVRVQGLAEPGALLVSDTTLRLLRAPVHSTAAGLVRMPGHTDPLMAYMVQGLEAPAATRAWSPFVGRQRELALLDALLARALTEQGQVVSLVGEPGIGKSRLLAAFRERLQGQAVTVLAGACRAYSRFLPYGPISELLRHQCRLGPTAAPDVVATQVARLLQEVGLVPEDSVPYLLPLLDGPTTTEPLAHLEPAVLKERTFAVLRQVHLRTAQQQPLLLVVDNLHWIDPTSEAYLASLVDQLAGVPLLLLTTSRPGYRPRWLDKSYATQLTLPPLTRTESAVVVDAVLPPARYAAALVQRILTRAAGNPLFLEELAHAVREHEGLVVDTPVPATIQAVLAARLDRLPPEAKHLLYTAAVIGPEVPMPLLAAIAELPQDVLQRRLGYLQAAEFLYATRLVPAPAYTFKHALTHEVAYGSLVQERRRTLHGRLVDVLEVLAEDRVADQLDRLAYHARHGERWDKALAYYRQAGVRASGKFAYREAVEYFEQAIQALEHLHETGGTRVLAIELRLALGNALGALGEYGRRLALLGEAEALARALDDRARLGRVLGGRANVLRITGDLDGAIAVGRQALELVVELGDSALQVHASYNLGQAYQAIGDFGRAAELLRRSVVTADRESSTRSTALCIHSRVWLVRTLSALGAFAEGRRHGEETLRLSMMEGQSATPILAYSCLGILYLAKGDLEHAIRAFDQGLAETLGMRPLQAHCHCGLGTLYARTGQRAQAGVALSAAIELYHAMEMTFWLPQAEAALVQVT